MKVLRRELLQLVGVIAAACASMETGSAQNYPTRPITMIVPFAAGGTTDVTARIVGEHMPRTLGQQIIVENVVGAGGTVGTARAMRANPDGHTIEMGQMGTHAAAVALYPNLAYKPDLHFEPIGMASRLAALIVARKDFPPKDLQEFITFVKANYNKLNVAHSGVGSIFFTTCLLLNSILDVKPTLVPFNGGGPAINALVGGQVDYLCGDVAASISQLHAGTIKAYAVGTAERNPILPDVPTSKEAGLPEFQASAWNALFAPKGTPKSVLDKLTDALDKALDDATTRKRLLELGSDIPDKAGRGQQPLAALVKSEIAKWTPIIKAAGANVN
jgi:tripartite-type tricarboxylate transporter receptor subunit TctC